MSSYVKITDLQRSLQEAVDAVTAFETYCLTYDKHGISPRLDWWRTDARKLLGTTGAEGLNEVERPSEQGSV